MASATGAVERATQRGRRRRWRGLRWAFRALVIAAVGYLGWRFARGIAWARLAGELRHADPAPVAITALLCVALAPLKALRARLLLMPLRALPVWRLSEWYLGSWAADNLLMSQAGVGLRVALIRGAGVPLLAAGAQQAFEKALDAASLLLLLPLVRGSLVSPSASGAHALAGGRAPLWLLVLLLGLPLCAGAAWILGRPALRHVARAAAALKQPAVALAVGGLSVLQWAVELAMLALTLRALHLPVTVTACARAVFAVNFAALAPGLPANLGTFEAAATAALVSSGIDNASALGAALLFHALHTIPVTALGLSTLRQARFRVAPGATGL